MRLKSTFSAECRTMGMWVAVWRVRIRFSAKGALRQQGRRYGGQQAQVVVAVAASHSQTVRHHRGCCCGSQGCITAQHRRTLPAVLCPLCLPGGCMHSRRASGSGHTWWLLGSPCPASACSESAVWRRVSCLGDAGGRIAAQRVPGRCGLVAASNCAHVHPLGSKFPLKLFVHAGRWLRMSWLWMSCRMRRDAGVTVTCCLPCVCGVLLRHTAVTLMLCWLLLALAC